MDLLIRDVVPEDAEALTLVLNPIIDARVHTALDSPLSVDAERDYIVNFHRRGVWKVAVRRSDHQLLGFQILEPFATYTRAFDHVATVGTYVDLAQRRQGIAKALFGSTLPAARQNGYEKLFTFVRADNPIALKTYLAHGFTIIGTARQHAKIDGCYVDEILIERLLDGRTWPAASAEQESGKQM